jgi:hypothetical protein
LTAEDGYDEKRDQAVPPVAPTPSTSDRRPHDKSLATERRRKETEVIVNLGGSFIAAGSLAPKHNHRDDQNRGLARVNEDETMSERENGNDKSAGAGGPSIDVHLTSTARGKDRLDTVPESIPPSTTMSNLTQANTRTGTATATDGEESYLAKKMAHIMTNERAFKVLNRIEQKLAGTDRQTWGGMERANRSGGPIEVDEQVQYLIEEATKHENLAQGKWKCNASISVLVTELFGFDVDRVSLGMAANMVRRKDRQFDNYLYRWFARL